MDRKRKIILSASIIAIAAGAGQLVQSNIGGANKQAEVAAPTGVVMLSGKAGSELTPAVRETVAAEAQPTPAPQVRAPLVTPPAAEPQPVALPAAPEAAPPAMPRTASIMPLPSVPGPAPVAADAEPAMPAKDKAPATHTAAAEDPAAPSAAAKAPAAVATDTCMATLSATVLPGAVLSLGLVAPCDGGARVVLRHGGLAITGKLSAAGTLFTTLPAMEAKGEVAVLFPDGTTTRAAAAADLTGIRRLAVQWQDADAFQLQAYENGAAFGAPGHVSAERPVGEGRVDQLGDATVELPMLAQVYTWPAGSTPVEVTIEAAVTAGTCNREILGEAVESAEGRVVATDITLAMPDCSAVGDFLVLNNLPGGTTLAAAE
jgi:hypothetical protein